MDNFEYNFNRYNRTKGEIPMEDDVKVKYLWIKNMFSLRCKQNGLVVPENIEDIISVLIRALCEASDKENRLIYTILGEMSDKIEGMGNRGKANKR